MRQKAKSDVFKLSASLKRVAQKRANAIIRMIPLEFHQFCVKLGRTATPTPLGLEFFPQKEDRLTRLRKITLQDEFSN